MATGSGNAILDETCFGPGTETGGLFTSVASALDDENCAPVAPATQCTQTLALKFDSPAIDANATCGPGLFDQRGVARTQGACDAGAFELGDCPSSPATVATEAELALAIGCYNNLPADSPDVKVTMTSDITLTQDLPGVFNQAWSSS